MRVVMFYHSLVSDWNHGNAHFLRGIASELLALGHQVRIYEPADSWSRNNLLGEHGQGALEEFQRAYPQLSSTIYDALDMDEALSGADLVLVHEWNDRELVARIGRHRAARGGYQLLFHDTHHRSVSDPDAMEEYDLSDYDGVLAFGDVICRLYLERRWARRAWTWHEAADVRVFKPQGVAQASRLCESQAGRLCHTDGELVWIGNWGDEERTAELQEFLIEPVRRLGIKANVYGVRYPERAKATLAAAGIAYGGYLPNNQAAEIFARHRVTVHVPRRPYVQALPGIPTIRVFEALACGMPLVSAPWNDCEHLFTPGSDFLAARDGDEMCRQLGRVLSDPDLAQSLADNGRRTILARHTCAHRVQELLEVCAPLTRDSGGCKGGLQRAAHA